MKLKCLFYLILALFVFDSGTTIALADVAGDPSETTGTAYLQTPDDEAGFFGKIWVYVNYLFYAFYILGIVFIALAWVKFNQREYASVAWAIGGAIGLFLTPRLVTLLRSLAMDTA